MSDAAVPPVMIDGASSDGTSKRYRHPSDVARLLFALLVLGALALLEAIAPTGLTSVTIDVLVLVDDVPPALRDGLVGLVQLTAVLAPFVVLVVAIRKRQFALLLILVLAGAVAGLLMALLSGTVEDTVPIEELGLERANSWLFGTQYPSSSYIAGMTALLVAASPWLTRSWRLIGWAFLLAAVAARMLSATDVPLRSGMLLALGAAAGSAALLVFGAPRRRIDLQSVCDTLLRSGLDVARIAPFDHRGPDPLFEVEPSAGRPLIVKVLGRDQRDADTLLVAWRALTVKGIGEVRAIGTPSLAVRHEAVALSVFDAAGADVPSVRCVLSTPDEAALLATTKMDGRGLGTLVADDVEDGAIRDAFRQVALLQERRLAHRALNPGNVFIDGDHTAFVNLRRADLQAVDEVLGADVAELLVSFALVVGIPRTLAAAQGELSIDHLVRAVPLIQAAVFTRLTKQALAALDDSDAFLEDLRDRAADAADVEKVELTPTHRITIVGAVSLVGSLVLVGYIFTLASDWNQIWEAFSEADLRYVLPVAILGLVPYLTGALSMLGAVPVDLSYFRTTSVMFGQSYLNRFTPANAGGMAMRIRYLQLEGLDGTVAATSIGLTSAASGVAQAVMIVVFLLWGGASDRLSDFEVPDVGGIVIAMLVVGGIATTAMIGTAWGRERVVPWFRQTVGRVRETTSDLASNPRKMCQLFGGAVLGKVANIAAFWLSMLAFDVDISFPKAGALYIIASTLGSAIPTPGGVGGVEAALTAALLAYGADNASAAGIVLLFRILTFWLPTVPSYAFLKYTQRTGVV